jgi:thymidylate synthase
MKAYLDIVQKVLDTGRWKSPVRKNVATNKWEAVDGGVRTLACANVLFSHDMKDGFPLLTTKRVAWKSIRVELEGFIKGITSKKWYKDRGCKIWNEWCNPDKVPLFIDDNGKPVYHSDCMGYPTGTPPYCFDEEYVEKCILHGKFRKPSNDERKKFQLEEEDLGPIYGFQWRRFGQCYDENDNGWAAEKESQVAHDADQLATIVHTLNNNPMDRRMVCSAWNPLQVRKMALPPCHWGWNVTVIGDELHMIFHMRSVDTFLGMPFNIASYALLLELLAKNSGFKAGNLTGTFADCHIYENSIPACQEQLSRTPKTLPTLVLPDIPDLFNWSYDQSSLTNYDPAEPIKVKVVV